MSKQKENGRYVVVRGDRSGVFAGNIVEKDGREVTLENCRRLWYWSGASSISQIAESGVTRPSQCKFTVTVPRTQILDAIEIIDATPAAEANIKAVSVWKQ